MHKAHVYDLFTCTTSEMLHIPSSVMKVKLREFMALKQGSKTIREYVQAFNDLARYASNHVDTDAKKRECFLEGMSPKL